jgi:hypothetical protein
MEARAEYGGATTPSSFPHSFVPPPFPLQTEHGGGSRSGEEARRGLVAASSSWRSSSAAAASSFRLDPTVGLRPSEEAPSSLAGPASATCDLPLHQARVAHPLPADWRAMRHPPPPSAASSPLAARRLLSLPPLRAVRTFYKCGGGKARCQRWEARSGDGDASGRQSEFKARRGGERSSAVGGEGRWWG